MSKNKIHRIDTRIRRTYKALGGRSYKGKMKPLRIRFLKYLSDNHGFEIEEGRSAIKCLIDIWDSCEVVGFRPSVSRRDIPTSTWRALRKKVFSVYGEKCLRCGNTDNIAVDHIRPYIYYPELRMDFNNLQPLCQSCNSSKGTKIIDYRI